MTAGANKLNCETKKLKQKKKSERNTVGAKELKVSFAVKKKKKKSKVNGPV